MKKIKYYIPKVKEAAVFKEIALNIVNPLEVIREGISNSFDADAKYISIVAKRDEKGNFILEIYDDGIGMDLENIHKFFNLGDSQKTTLGIGEKGLGTKTYYKSDKITVFTRTKGGIAYKATMDKPWYRLINGEVPEYIIEELNYSENITGTKVVIENYKVDNPEKYFNYDTMKDYILWFTAGGSFRNLFAHYTELYKLIKNMQIAPRIFIDDKITGFSDEIVGVHHFAPPQEIPTEDPNELIYNKSVNYCRHFGPFHRDTNINGEYVSMQIYGTISGINCRRSICRLRQGETYKSRFGVYLAKDFIPFTKRNDLLGDEHYYHYHILINSQDFMLTADRNNLSNENDLKIKWVLEQAKDIIYTSIKPLSESGYFTLRKREEEEYMIRSKISVLHRSIENLCKLDNLEINKIPITKKPYCETQVALLFVSLLSNDQTRCKIDAIKKIVAYYSKNTTDMICIDNRNKQVLVEFEHRLSNLFRHQHPIGTFDYVVCWEVDIELNTPKQLSNVNVVLVNENNKFFLKYADGEPVQVIELKEVVNALMNNEAIMEENC